MIPDGYRIRELTAQDARALADAYRRNREHLAPWDPARDESFYTDEGQAAAMVGQLAAARQGWGCCGCSRGTERSSGG